ncbi:MAG: S49 family peptidase [Alphaproteobacteria bacterium]|nr:MAG: S49 family peptidase [Alphaproteobacteria bacterium]
MYYIKKFFKFLFAYLGFTALLLFIVPSIASYFKHRPPPPNSLLTIQIDAPLAEKESYSIFNFNKDPSLQKLRHALNAALDNPNIKGVLIEVSTPYIGGYAQVEELRRIIGKFKDAKKPVYFYTRQFGEASNATSMYYLASACSGIYLQPGGTLSFLGMGIEKFFMKDFFDKLGIKFDVFRQKEFKGVQEPFIYDDFSPTVKSNLTRYIKDAFTEVKQNIANDRGKTIKDIEEMIQNAPLRDQEAYAQGYVNGVLYRDEFYELFKKYNLVKLSKYHFTEKKKSCSKRVAVLYYEGMFLNYTKGQELSNAFNERQFEKQINRIIDQKYDGIVIRINSGGGCETAAEAMYGVLLRARQKGLKIVISMGDVAASAGYLIGCASDKIIAEALTITGSIGVTRMIPNAKGLFEKLGLHSSALGEGENLNVYTMTKALTKKQKERFMESTRYAYEDFIAKVAKARNKTLEEVDEIAKGQVWTGRVGLELGLIDALGGMETAYEQMNLLLGTDRVQFVDLGGDFGGFMEQIMDETNSYVYGRMEALTYNMYQKTLNFMTHNERGFIR